jgi:hypothetical protein
MIVILLYYEYRINRVTLKKGPERKTRGLKGKQVL